MPPTKPAAAAPGPKADLFAASLPPAAATAAPAVQIPVAPPGTKAELTGMGDDEEADPAFIFGDQTKPVNVVPASSTSLDEELDRELASVLSKGSLGTIRQVAPAQTKVEPTRASSAAVAVIDIEGGDDDDPCPF
jgi:hypothetical protein